MEDEKVKKTEDNSQLDLISFTTPAPSTSSTGCNLAPPQPIHLLDDDGAKIRGDDKVTLTLPITPKLRTSERCRRVAAEWHGMPSPRLGGRGGRGRKRKAAEAPDGDDDKKHEKARKRINNNENATSTQRHTLSASSRIGVRKFGSTKPTPFSFEWRENELLERRKALVPSSDEIFVFKARPLPVLDEVRGLPSRRSPHLTQPKPFQLMTNQRGELYSQWLRVRMDEMEAEGRREREFKAKPATVLAQTAFAVEPSRKPLTECQDVGLRTEMRSEERKEWDVEAEGRRNDMEKVLEEREMMRKVAEEEDLARIREEAAFKANPITHYPPLVILPSSKPLTQPKQPNFSDRFKK